jgi:3-phosphoshikimate 1-carboxyvinyltransferase
MTDLAPSPVLFKPAPPLAGRVTVPGDKSISHRALMFSALAEGQSEISGLLEGEDVLATAAALRAMGATIHRRHDGHWIVDGVGAAGLREPTLPLDMGNSGTSTRLLMGLIAGHPIRAIFTGDASLSRRPMGRVIEPLQRMGATIEASEGGRLPLTLTGRARPDPIEYRLPVASAQVKSAVLLAGLNAAGTTCVIEPEPTRDHSERMLTGFGADLSVEQRDGARVISLTGGATLRPQAITVPGDPSSAAFLVVAGLLVPGSDVVVANVGLNPTRTGLFTLLRTMGGRIEETDHRVVGGEPVADLRVRYSALTGITVPPAIVPTMVDEFPIFFVAAALAEGKTVAEGLGELRVKESDRLALMAHGLTALGANVEERPDGITIHGRAGQPFAPKPVPVIAAELDHRIAMSFAVAGLASRDGVAIDDMAPVATSFPGFQATLHALGAQA